MKKILVLIVSIWIVSCSDSPDSNSPEQLVFPPQWVFDGAVYEVFVRNFSNEGTFDGVRQDLDRLQGLGIETLWLMPIHPVGELNAKGTYGSPYSVKDYYSVNPRFGTEEDFRELVEAVHQRGMHVIIDLVINHTSWDHSWTLENPQWYTRDEMGEMKPPVEDWWDVVELDFSQESLRDELLNVMLYWIEEFNIDGYRVDTAEMIEEDFWAWALPTVLEKHPEVLFLGEGGDTELFFSGFQMIYGWDSYFKFKDLWRGGITNFWVQSRKRETEAVPGGLFLRFTTNHDETSWDAPPVTLFGGLEGAAAAMVANFLLPGIPLVYNGQELGSDKVANLFEKTDYDFQSMEGYQDFYRRILELWREHPAFHKGNIEVIDLGQPRSVVSYRRVKEDQQGAVIVNLREREVTIDLSQEEFGGMVDLLSGGPATIGEITLSPYHFLILGTPIP